MKRILFGISLLLVPFWALAVSDDVIATDSSGAERDVFIRDEDMYVGGDCDLAADDRVDVYVVGNRSSWKDHTELEDLSGGVESIKIAEDGDVPKERVWRADTDQGTYDIVIDSHSDGYFDEKEDCVTSGSFKVIVSGDGSVSEGSNNPDEDFRWKIEKDTPEVVMLQVRLRATSDEDLHLTSFEVEVSGTGNDRTNLAGVVIAEDRGTSGVYDHGKDTIWGIGTYKGSSREVVVPVDITLPAGSTRTVIVVYVLGKELRTGDTFIAYLNEVNAKGDLSGANIRLDNLPIKSVTMDVYGSGDAKESVVFAEPVPVVTETSQDTTASKPSVTTKTKETLSGIFSGDNVDEAKDVSFDFRNPPTWFQNTVVIAGLLLGLLILVRILKFIVRLIVTGIEKMRGR